MVTIYNFAPEVDHSMLVKLDFVDDMISEKSKDTVCVTYYRLQVVLKVLPVFAYLYICKI